MKSGIEENLKAAEAAYRHGKFDEANAAYSMKRGCISS